MYEIALVIPGTLLRSVSKVTMFAAFLCDRVCPFACVKFKWKHKKIRKRLECDRALIKRTPIFACHRRDTLTEHIPVIPFLSTLS